MHERLLTQETLQEYEANGVVCLRGAFEPSWLDGIATDIENILKNPSELCSDNSIPSDTGRFFNGFFQWLKNPGIREFVLDSPAHQIAARITGSREIRFFYDQLLVKEPHTSQRTPWHCDADYFPIKGPAITSIWVPLEKVDRGNGGMRFIKGSHKLKLEDLTSRIPKKESRDQNKGMYVLPDFDDYPDQFEFLDWDLSPGDCLVFHIGIVHFAHGNSSARRRRALSTRWFGEGCTVDESMPHILNKENIRKFVEKCGFRWTGKLDNPLFPKFYG